MPSLQSILDSANREWDFWGRSTWHVPRQEARIFHADDEPAFAQYVIDAYCSVGGGTPTQLDISDDRYYWSAVGMSAIMKGAGFEKKDFPFAQSHSKFIRHFIKARRDNLDTAFWGFRSGETGGEPDVGDIVAYARGKGMSAVKAAQRYASTSSYDSHSDVVVAKRPGEIDVIGANVLDSVTRKTLRIDNRNHLVDDLQHYWFAVLKLR